MEIEENIEIPLILGRPFMLTTNYVVDMGNGNLEMSVENHKVPPHVIRLAVSG